MRVVVDSNVLLSALISRRSAPYAVYQEWLSGRFELLTSEMQIEEIRRVSRYARMREVVKPFIFGDMVNALREATLLDRLPDVEGAADPFDAFLLGMAVAGEADWLVTGDRRAGLLEMGRYGRCRIVTPAGFVGLVLG